jgi:hypothetical protein
MSESFAVLMAAVISAFVAVVGLVITKEHKISEFRQQWIDGLRDDVSSLIGAIVANQVTHDDRTTYRDIQLKLEEFHCRIELRFKPGDTTADPLLKAVKKLIDFGGQLNNPSVSDFLYILTKDVKEKTQEILKGEWERVKAGEDSYRQTLRFSKRAAKVASAMLILYLFGWFCWAVVPPLIGWMVSLFKG